MYKKNKYNKRYFEEKFIIEDLWIFRNSGYEQTKYRRQVSFIKKYCPIVKKILEIGCAEGVHTEILRRFFPGAKIIGVDISFKAIQRAKRRVKDAVFVQGDILEVLDRWRDNTFNVVILSETVYYLGECLNFLEMYRFLRKTKNILKKHGILVTANMVDLSDDFKMLLVKQPIIESYYTLFSGLFVSLEKADYKGYKKGEKRKLNYGIRVFRKS